MLQDHLELTDIIKEFESDYLGPMKQTRDSLWEMMETTTRTKEADDKYTLLNGKVVFLEAMVQRMRMVMSSDAVIVSRMEDLIQAFDEGNSAEMVHCINKIKTALNETYNQRIQQQS